MHTGSRRFEEGFKLSRRELEQLQKKKKKKKIELQVAVSAQFNRYRSWIHNAPCFSLTN